MVPSGADKEEEEEGMLASLTERDRLCPPTRLEGRAEKSLKSLEVAVVVAEGDA